MGQKLASLGRRGVAVIAGTALLGTALLVAGQGVASAATPTVIATSATAVNIPVTGAGVSGSPITLAIAGTPVAGDTIVLKLACTGATKVFASATTSPSTVIATPSSSGGCGGTVMDQLTLTTLPTSLNPSIVVTPAYTTAAAAAGAITLSGTYTPATGAATTFAVASDATVSPLTASGNVPPVTLGVSQTNKPISPVVITESVGGGLFTTAGVPCTLTLNTAGDTFASTPTIVNGAGTLTFTSGVGTAALAFTAKDDTTGAASFTISNLSVNTGPTNRGVVTATFACSPAATVTVPVFAVAASATRIAGPIADATVAAEFTSAFPAGPACRCVVLATDLDPFDALSASYLEGKLGTGVLITPENSFGPDAAGAIKVAGVTTVYVVGGSLAISNATIATIKATPAYNFGGTVLTGSNLVVANGGAAIAGATADDTAQLIATLPVTNSAGFPLESLASISGAYTATGVGAYNDTTGIGTAAPSATTTVTAVVVSDAGYQDAVSVGPIAYRYALPVLLTPGANTPGGTTIGTQAKAVLTTMGVNQVIIAGGQLAVDNGVTTSLQAMGISVLRIAGQDATDTAGQLANFELAAGPAGLAWSSATSTFLVGNGDVDGTDPLAWGDLLAAAPLGAQSHEPILQVAGTNSVGSFTAALLVKAGTPVTGLQGDTGINNMIVLGGNLAVSANTVSTMQTELAV